MIEDTVISLSWPTLVEDNSISKDSVLFGFWTGEINFILSNNLCHYWLAFMMSEDSMQVAGTENTARSYSVLDPECYSIELSGKVCPLVQ